MHLDVEKEETFLKKIKGGNTHKKKKKTQRCRFSAAAHNNFCGLRGSLEQKGDIRIFQKMGFHYREIMDNKFGDPL